MPLPLSRLPMSLLRSIRPAKGCVTALAIFAIAAGMIAGTAEARDDAACEQFDWPIKRELAFFRDADLEMVFSGATLGSVPDKGLAVALQPQVTVEFIAAPPGGETQSESAFGGLFFVKSVPQAGTYQVTLSGDVWVDLIQDGKALPLVAETVNRNCSEARKSMRFRLEPGQLTVQVSGASTNVIKLAIVPVH